jgi:Subtilase family
MKFAARVTCHGRGAGALGLCLWLFTAQGALHGQPAHKLQIDDPALAAQVLAQGGQLIADYGGYQLYRIPQIPAGLTNSVRVNLRDDYNLVRLNAARLDTTRPAVKALAQPIGPFAGRRMYLVQFAGPVLPGWRQSLVGAGAQLISYLPQNAYLVYGDAAALARLQSLARSKSYIQWEGPYLDDYKIHPAARPVDRQGRPRKLGTDWFAIQLVADAAANPATLQLLENLKLAPFPPPRTVLQYRDVLVRLSLSNLTQVAARPDVVSIQPFSVPRKFGERQDQIIAGNLAGTAPSGPGYLAWLAAKGFTQAQFSASGFTVDVSDSGIDNGTTAPNHFGLYTGGDLAQPSRVSYNRLEGTPNSGTLAGCDGHGTLNAHIIAGFDDLSGFPFTDSAGYHFGLGVCPFVKVGSSVVFDPDYFTYPDYNNLQSAAYQSGARISNNSWGSAGAGVYDITAQNFDALVRDAQPDGSTFPTAGNQEMTIVFAAGNAGIGAQTLDSPGTAKNVIAVGAAANVQPFGLSDYCGVPDSESDHADDIAAFSSRGPCADGRHKPDLVAPGTHISGGVVQAASPGPTGTADPCFTNDGSGICGGTNGDLFFPSGQEFYTASSGTSHAAPCVSGACALLRQYFINQFTNPPSPAMTKAYLLNSARYLTGVAAADRLWSDSQGMGELDLGMALDGAPRMLRDQLAADLFTASGQIRTFTGTVADTNKAFRVTLAWTDAPGSTTGAAYNNDLDLEVVAGGKVYLGNVFAGPYSTTGGAPDAADNVESVFLPAGVSGPFTVKIIATDVNSDGVPNNASPLDQDFALVVYNALQAGPLPVLQATDASLLSESCTPTNGMVDPGEMVTFSFTLQNAGLADTTNLVSTLLPVGGVTSPSAAQIYGALSAGGPGISRPFTFTAQGQCGGSITPTLQLQDGYAALGELTFTLPLGQVVPLTAFSENFDAVQAPDLPAGWSTATSGAGIAWSTSTVLVDSPPNAVFTPDASQAGVSELISPVFAISSALAQLSFRQYYALESYPSGGAVYDGGVLEIKIGNGPFADIIDAGGSFVTGGYVGRIYGTGNNPLADRAAWSFDTGGGYITAVVNLPPTAAGQNVQLKWRLGTDLSNTYGGDSWWIDTITVQDGQATCCRSLAPRITGIQLSQTNVLVSLDSLIGVQYTLQFKNGLGDSQWLPLGAPTPGTGGTLVLTDTNPPISRRFYRVLAH